jgi:hypothetical protein
VARRVSWVGVEDVGWAGEEHPLGWVEDIG